MRLRLRSLLPALALFVMACDPPKDQAADAAPTTPPAPTATSAAEVGMMTPGSAAMVPASAPPEPSAPPAPPTVVGAAHVLVAYKGALGAAPAITRSKADAKKRAEEARKLLTDKKKTFDDLVKEYNDDPLSKATNGAIGNFARNVFPKSFEEATFNMEVGGISDVVETPRGFHIIKRTK